MPILENQLNGRIATLLRVHGPSVESSGDRGAFPRNLKQPDIWSLRQALNLHVPAAQ